jgi:Flp pilus assembly protein TadD
VKGRLEKEPRNIIPRWRPFAAASRTDAELASTAKATVNAQEEAGERSYQISVRDFEEGQSVWDAGDLLALAISRRDHETARRVANFVAAHQTEASEALTGLTSVYLGKNGETSPWAGGTSLEIKALRRRVADFPRTAVAWADLAFYLTLAGSFENADRAIRTALHLAPNNRFILRAASRFYIHQERLDEAHHLLTRADATPHDPWLVAAEIATARSASATSRLIKRGRSMLEDHNFSPRHTSELASALGTLEGDSPTARRPAVRRLIAKSLIDPTENSVAQAQWHATNTGFARSFNNDPATRTALRGDHVFEASAWQSYIEGDFGAALQHAQRWFEDQPFSARPAFLASQIASLLCLDPKTAVLIAKQALVPNPDEFMLWNNLAYAHAVLGEINEARDAISHVEVVALDPLSKLYVTATNGAIAFRSGDSENGRKLYMQAMQEFAEAGGAHEDFDLYALAFAHLAYEEAVAKSPDALQFYNVVAPLTKRVNRSDFREVVRVTGVLLSANSRNDEKIIIDIGGQHHTAVIR